VTFAWYRTSVSFAPIAGTFSETAADREPKILLHQYAVPEDRGRGLADDRS
jgi:hypothetical protein